MKIKLLVDVPVDPVHGLVAGMVLDAVPNPDHPRGFVKWWVVGAGGNPVGIIPHEAEEVQDAPAQA